MAPAMATRRITAIGAGIVTTIGGEDRARRRQ